MVRWGILTKGNMSSSINLNVSTRVRVLLYFERRRMKVLSTGES